MPARQAAGRRLSLPSPAAPPAGPTIDDIVAALQRSGEGGRGIAVIGVAREVGTTLTAIALARALARTARVVLVDLAFNSPNVEVISNDPSAPGMAELVRGQASFEDVITRDRGSRRIWSAPGRSATMRTACCNRRCSGARSARSSKATIIS